MSDKKKDGRPTKYKKEYAERAYKLSLLGYTDKQLAAFWGVDKQTIYNWKEKHKDFFDSITRGKEIADGDVVESLYNRAKGYNYTEKKITKRRIQDIDGEGGEGFVIDETTHEKHLPPDTQAAARWLGNRQRKKWKYNPDNHTEETTNQHYGDINVYFKDEKDLPINEHDIEDFLDD